MMLGELLSMGRVTVTDLFCVPTPRKIAQRKLDDARRRLLENQAAAEYHKQMNVYYQNVILQLEDFLRERR